MTAEQKAVTQQMLREADFPNGVAQLDKLWALQRNTIAATWMRSCRSIWGFIWRIHSSTSPAGSARPRKRISSRNAPAYATNKTDLDFFALLNNSEVLHGQTRTLSTSEDFDVPAVAEDEDTVEIALPTGALNPYIDGMTLATGAMPTAGSFTFTAGSEGAAPVVTLLADDVAGVQSITIFYDEKLDGTSTVAVRDNVASASGSAEMRYRVYGAGENASVVGYLIIQIYKCKVTTKPGFENSYGQSGTHSVTFTSLDAGRQDHNLYELIFQPIA